MTSAPPDARKQAVWNTAPLEHVKRIVAIASGKGGVGKSSTSVNLALALSHMGPRVGILDADIYGPSIPRMLNIGGRPKIKDNKMLPLENHGIRCMSMEFITGDEAAIMRGPMISKTLQQLLRFTRWGTKESPLDLLLVDMPPGTGDIHLSMAQQVPLDGAVIVTTPQEVAVIDARKALKMFQKVDVPVLGVIENMSGSIFGSGGGKKLAEEMQVPFLGEIPMDAAIVEASDSGKPYTGTAMATYQAISMKIV
jgi:ATP-binding protein involved in chromosome partitioning